MACVIAHDRAIMSRHELSRRCDSSRAESNSLAPTNCGQPGRIRLARQQRRQPTILSPPRCNMAAPRQYRALQATLMLFVSATATTTTRDMRNFPPRIGAKNSCSRLKGLSLWLARPATVQVRGNKFYCRPMREHNQMHLQAAPFAKLRLQASGPTASSINAAAAAAANQTTCCVTRLRRRRRQSQSKWHQGWPSLARASKRAPS